MIRLITKPVLKGMASKNCIIEQIPFNPDEDPFVRVNPSLVRHIQIEAQCNARDLESCIEQVKKQFAQEVDRWHHHYSAIDAALHP